MAHVESHKAKQERRRVKLLLIMDSIAASRLPQTYHSLPYSRPQPHPIFKVLQQPPTPLRRLTKTLPIPPPPSKLHPPRPLNLPNLSATASTNAVSRSNNPNTCVNFLLR